MILRSFRELKAARVLYFVVCWEFVFEWMFRTKNKLKSCCNRCAPRGALLEIGQAQQ